MEILPPWAEGLHIGLEQIQTWLQSGAPAVSLLEWCLDNGKIKEQEYLNWAKEYYSLAVLKANFFENPVPFELWNKTKAPHWKESLFPLVEWDGVLFLGCLHPPATKPVNSPVQYVLAPRSLQKIWWQALNKPNDTIAEDVVAEIDEEVIDTSPGVLKSKPEEFELTFEIHSEEQVSAATPIAMTPPAIAPAEPSAPLTMSSISAREMPAGLSADLKLDEETQTPEIGASFEAPLGLSLTPELTKAAAASAGPSLSLSMANDEAPAHADTPKPEEPEAPAGLTLTFETLTPAAAPTVAPPMSIATPTLTLVPPQAPALAPTPAPSMVKPSPSMTPKAPAPVVMPPPPPTMAKSTTMPPPPPMSKITSMPPPPPMNAGVPLAPPAPPVAVPPPALVFSAPPPLSAPPPVMPTNPSASPVQEVLERMHEHFEQSMAFTYKDETLKPLKWDGSWSLTNNAAPPVDLSGPSIFRIVLDTKSPYHGYVASSPVNDAFFATWNKGKLPEHLTLVPMIMNNEVVGMLLGITSRTRGAMVPLHQYQSLGIELAIRVERAA